MNFKGLGKKQKHVLKRMAKHNLKISACHDSYTMESKASLKNQDGDNVYESISGDFIESLHKRNLFKIEHWHPSLRIMITTINLKPKAKAFIIKNL